MKMHLLKLAGARSRNLQYHLGRLFSTSCSTNQQKKGIILGVYSGDKDDSAIEGTKSFQSYDSFLSGKLTTMMNLTKSLKPGSTRLYFGTEKCSIVSVVSLGEKNPAICNEGRDVRKENIRKGIASGLSSFKDLGVESVEVDVADHPSAAAEGAYLSAWKYKAADREKYPADIAAIKTLPDNTEQINDADPTHQWNEGRTLAQAQNFARHLMDSPGNLMTPTVFCNTVKEKLEACDTKGAIKVLVREQDWIVDQKMNSFLSVAKGSDEVPKFMEIHYTGPGSSNDTSPLVLIGKGITFDTGGISIKPSKGMDNMRADMGGAANVASAILAAAELNTSGKVIGLIPLCENMPSGKANKPGDVVTAKDGTTIQVDNTDAEGRLILADALCYARELKPSAIVDLATLTGAMVVALGGGAAGVFTNNDNLWTKLDKAGYTTGDRVWRMPIYQLYTDQIKPAHLADINNVGKYSGAAGACTAAMFLHHFVETGTPWAHIDIASVMENDEIAVPYLGSGMGGRPARTLAQFIRNYFD